MVLTEDQQRAVTTRNKNLLVAAAAGSGKTKVLVERVKQLILEGECDVDRMLVVTFTNAAAAEMRSRIHTALKEELNKETNFETLKRLEKQSVLLTGASITTMHSFCQTLIKQNFTKIGLDPKFRVGDDNELNVLKRSVVEKLIEEKYENAGEEFKRFSDDFGGTATSDKKIFDVIIQLYEFAQSQVNPNEWLNSLKSNFDIADNASLKDTIWYESAMQDIGFALDAAYDECKITLEMAYENKVYADDIEHDMYYIVLPIKTTYLSGNWNKTYALLNPDNGKLFEDLSRKPKNVSKENADVVKKGRENYKGIIDKLRNRYFLATEDVMLSDLRELKTSVEILIDTTIEFSEAFADAKRDKNVIDFNDMEHFALKILSDKSVSKALKKKFQAVMVDEYQDTNGVQEAILTAIADKEKANLFAVGDVKQSIYKFRLADPSLFLEKYNTYPTIKDYDSNDEKAINNFDCLRIDLSKNFRSRPEVLNAVNFVFERLMTAEAMEIDYTEEARLYKGFDYPYGPGKLLNTPVELHIVQDCDNKDTAANDDDDTKIQDPETAKGIEREAQIIANRIKDLISSHTQVYDTDENKYRDITYRDIVILRRSNKNPAALMDVLQKNKIPAYAIGDETYFKKTEIQLIMALLTVLENMRQDIPLAAVMLSVIGGFTPEDLANLKIASRKDDLNTILMTAAMSSIELNPLNLPQELLEKSRAFLQKINTWREQARMISVPDLLTMIYNETGYYEYVGGLTYGLMRQANLRMLIDRAATYDSAGFRGLSRFLKFISKIKELNTDLSTARTLGENEDVVRVMTIHKSKGLEFPVVFVCELGKKLNINEDSYDNLVKHRKLGIAPYRTLANEPMNLPNFARQVISQRNAQEQQAEELRILYVAMTRAREKLILIGTKKGNDKKYEQYKRYGKVDKIPSFALLSATTFLDWLMQALSKETDCINVINVNSMNIIMEDETSGEEVKLMKADMTKLAHKTSVLTSKSVPSKMSVTELKRRIEMSEELTQNLIDDKYSLLNYRRPNFEQVHKITGAEYGTIMHSLMQRLDLNGDLTKEGILKQANSMLNANIFTEEQLSVISASKAALFFTSDIGKRMLSSNEVYRELPFSQLVEASKFFPNVDDKIFIQGIIDVLFKDEDNNYVLIDYKTDRIDSDDNTMIERMKSKYGLQIEVYGDAIESIINKSIDERYLYMLSSGEFIKME